MIDLNYNKEFLMAVLNAIPEPIFVKDNKHIFIFVNDAYVNFFGKKKEEVLGNTDINLYLKREVEIFLKKDDEVLNTGKTNINEEEYTDLNEIRHIIMTTKSLYITKNGERFIVGLIREVTKERESEQLVEKRTAELEKMNALIVDREKKMIELKEEIEILRKTSK